MVKLKRKGSIKVISVMLMVVMMFVVGSLSAFAAEQSAAQRELTNGVQSSLSENEYEASGGGIIKGKDLFTGDTGSGYTLNESKFNELTSSAQTQLVKDIASKSYEVKDGSANVSEETIQDWWKELQNTKGAGSKFLNVVLENTKPDFVTANQIYAPFSGVIGTIMGLIAILGMSALGLVIVADIFYIVIPPVRMLVSDENSGDSRGSRKGASKLFSNDAIYAIKVAEESDDANGGKKQALGIYLKRRIPMLILLGICLMYLASGQIYTFVGWILDLVSGFIGF